MMVKTDVSSLYKTKLCKKYSANGYCPYGVRCQFIHDIADANPLVQATLKGSKAKKAKALKVLNETIRKVQEADAAAAQPAIPVKKSAELNTTAKPFIPGEPTVKQTESSIGFGNK